ncbi:MAG: YbbC/YhhH family protein [Chitinophagaceae bacterium]
MKTTKIIINTIVLAVLFSISVSAQTKNKLIKYHLDYVPNKKTAIKIAEAIWLPIYGEEIYDDTPFIATLKDSSVWVVKGTFKNDYMNGGVPYIWIQKKDCKVLKVIHGK